MGTSNWSLMLFVRSAAAGVPLLFLSSAHSEPARNRRYGLSWAEARKLIRDNTSDETKQFIANERKRPAFQAYSHRAPPSASSLDQYKFGMDTGQEQMWRYRIYSYGLAAILANEFNGNKCGSVGRYSGRACEHQMQDAAGNEFGLYPGSDYTGHNIAALVVNEYGRVLTCAFNHNKLFNSTHDHAEMRLMDTCFQCPSLHFQLEEVDLLEKCCEIEDAMKRVTVYTTLEPCQQCTGRLLLASVPQIVYLQRDPD